MISANEYDPYYKSYIELSLKKPFVEALTENRNTVIDFFKAVPQHKLEYAYAEGKWTPKDILLHLTDAERVFAYRALRIARNDKTELSGFEQNDYVPMASANMRTIDSLIEEYNAVRNASIALFKSFSPEMLLRIGNASSSAISVRAIGYILTGHENHHMAVIKERYL